MSRILLVLALSGVALLGACGKKGDPKPPAEPAAQQTDEDAKKKTQ